MNTVEHPFAQYVRILGKGKHSGRSLNREEARIAFRMILDGKVEDIQLGAFLLLQRVKGETAEEMVGFAEACRSAIQAPSIPVDIDWPSYAGKRKQQFWFLLAARLLADNGYRIFMHGASGHTANRHYSEQMTEALQIPVSDSWQQAEEQLSQENITYLPVKHLHPKLDALFHYRNTLGVRTPVHSLIKLVNPLNAPTLLQSVFHPAYLEVHQQAAIELGYPQGLVLKGESGEVEFRPDADNKLHYFCGGNKCDEQWPRLQASRQNALQADQINTTTLQDLWRCGTDPIAREWLKNGTQVNDLSGIIEPYGLRAVVATMAMVLFAHHGTENTEQAWQKACELWNTRNRNRL